MRSFTLFSLLLCLLATLALALPEAAPAEDLEVRGSHPSVDPVSGKYQPHVETNVNPLAASSAKLKATCPAGTGLCSTGVGAMVGDAALTTIMAAMARDAAPKIGIAAKAEDAVRRVIIAI
ncbi:hypothetical protein RhiJN_22664 [Ceratobasidium sp. AG-Ba]|nr:hypothetical protein RhiJN_22664 [Ceratobasidium sp. AG-Ba]